jgi:hypothetical protein
MFPNTPFFPLPGLKAMLLVGKCIHPLTSFIKPSPLGDKIGQKLADLHKGTIIVPKARHCFMYRRTLDTIQTGGTNHPLTPFQLTANASIPIALIV